MTCRKRGKANHMDVVIHSILCRFFRRLEQRSYVDVPAHIGKGCGENLLASVVSVLPHLSQENTGTAAFQCFKSVGQFLCFFQFRGTVKFAGIYTGNSMDGSVETAGYFFNRIGNFTEGRTVMSRLYRKFKQVTVFTAFCRFGDCFQIAGNSLRITDASQFSRRLICALRTAVLSMDSTFSGSSFARRYLFKPTMVSLPLSISA